MCKENDVNMTAIIYVQTEEVCLCMELLPVTPYTNVPHQTYLNLYLCENTKKLMSLFIERYKEIKKVTV